MKKVLKALSKKIKGIHEAICENKLALFQTVLLLWIAIRVESLHLLVYSAASVIMDAAYILSVKISAAQDQFGAAISSILSLFGGDAS